MGKKISRDTLHPVLNQNLKLNLEPESENWRGMLCFASLGFVLGLNPNLNQNPDSNPKVNLEKIKSNALHVYLESSTESKSEGAVMLCFASLGLFQI